MWDNAVQMEPLKKNNDLRTATGVKDTFLMFFIDKLDLARKKASSNTDRENITLRLLTKMPTDVLSPVWRLRGEVPVCFR